MTWIEVLVGASETEALVREFLNGFKVVFITDEVAEQALVDRRARKIKLPDSILIATAIRRGGVFITRNTRDLPRNEKHIRIPYRLPTQGSFFIDRVPESVDASSSAQVLSDT